MKTDMIILKKGKETILAYSRIELRQLEPPFATQCQDYGKFGCDSQRDCIQRCVIQRLMSRKEPIPFDLAIVEDTGDVLVKNETFKYTSNDGISCRKLYKRTACLEEKVKTWKQAEIPAYGATLAYLLLPTFPDIFVSTRRESLFLSISFLWVQF